MMAIMLANPRLLLKTTTRLTLKHGRGKENTSGYESGAKEDDVPENEDPMREYAPYGEPSALELSQDQRVSNPGLIPDWDVIEDANRCNRAILSKGKEEIPKPNPKPARSDRDQGGERYNHGDREPYGD